MVKGCFSDKSDTLPIKMVFPEFEVDIKWETILPTHPTINEDAQSHSIEVPKLLDETPISI